jgi:AraC-like DNA-binding protein
VRLERAEMLLTSTSLAISHIAARCGFPDSNYFCVAFKAKYGLSPSKYRAKHKSTESAAGKNKL